MEKYSLKIEGTTPLLLEKYILQKTSTTKKVDYSDEWKDKTYLSPDGFVIITGEMFKACLNQGSKGLKNGKLFMSKLIPTGLVLQDFETKIHINKSPITLKDIEKNGWINYYRKVISGKSNIGNRTQIPPGWTMEWNFINREVRLRKDDVQEVIKNAGLYCGLGGQRPSSPRKPGNYGQFKILNFELV